MEKSKRLLDKYWFLIIFILSIPATWALFVSGFYGASDDIHIAWLNQFHKALMMGQIPPRFVPDLSFGFGYPLFNFVFPLPFYMGEIFHLLGLSLVDSIKAVFFISVPLSGVFMYLLLRQYTIKSLSLLGAALYIYTPYRAVDLYIRGAIGEIVSFALLPLILLSAVKITKFQSFRWVGIGAISLASLVLSHNITAYMFFPFVGLFLLGQIIFSPVKRKIIKQVLMMIILGFLISIYFWLPAIVDSKLMKYDTVFNFSDHFPTIRQLAKPYWGYGASVPGPYDGMPFFLGGVNIFVLIMSIIILFLKWKEIEIEKKIMLVCASITIATALFLMNYRSAFIWASVPMLPYFQFPWRFLILTTFFIPILVIVFGYFKYQKYLIWLLLIIIISTSFYFRPQDFLGRTDEYFLNRYVPHPVASEEYKKTQEEYLRLPKNTQVRPDKLYPRIIGDGIKEVKILNDLNASFTVESNKSTTINYNKYLFPGWTVSIDNKETNIKPGLPFGQITFSVPAGMHKVKVDFEETQMKKVLDAISLGSFLVSLLLVKNLWIRSKKSGLS